MVGAVCRRTCACRSERSQERRQIRLLLVRPKVNPVYDFPSGDPRFQRLLGQVGLEK